MNDQTRNIIIGKLGTIMLANAELASENVRIAQVVADQKAVIADLRRQVAEAKRADGKGAEQNGAALGRPEGGDNLPANPYANGDGNAKPH